MKNLIVLKFGGSSITKKEENKFEMNNVILKQAASELANALKQNPKLKIALVCGVGPFGHTNVVKYNLNNGINNSVQEKGVKITNKDCDFVGKETAKALEKEGLKVKFIPGYEICVQENKKVKHFELALYKKALANGEMPLSTGVMVPDEKMKWSVMSGDTVIAQLAKQLRPEKVLMGTDVDGIYTADPKNDDGAELILEINNKNLKEVLKKAGESKAMDVTGGMKGKLEKLAEQLNGVPAEIFNLFIAGNLKKALLCEEIKSTKIDL
ncbi:MAG: isopentenyl phosphate kinase [archaeon]